MATIIAEISELCWCTYACNWGETDYNRWKTYVEDNAQTKTPNEWVNAWRKAFWALIINVTWEEAARRFYEGDDLYTEKILCGDTKYTRISLLDEMRDAIREDTWNSEDMSMGSAIDSEEDFQCVLDEDD